MSSLAFHPTSAFFLCSASSGGVLQVWDVREGACIQRHTVDANPVAHFSPHGRWVACGGASGHVIIIDLDDGAVVATLRRGEDRNVAVNAVAFSPVELLAAVAHENGHVAIWDLNEFSRVGDVNAGAKRGGSSFSGDGSALICAREGGVGIVRLDMPLRVESIEAQLGDNVAYVACEADDETGTVLAVGSDIRAVRIEVRFFLVFVALIFEWFMCMSFCAIFTFSVFQFMCFLTYFTVFCRQETFCCIFANCL